jgi:hypothetical protein
MFFPLFAVLILGLLWSIYWFVAFTLVKERAADVRRQFAEAGTILECARESWGGYPFRFEFSCENPVVQAPDRMGMTTQALLVVALAYKPWHVIGMMDGPTTFANNQGSDYSITHGRAVFSIQFATAEQLSLSVEATSLELDGPIQIEKALIHVRTQPRDSFDVAIQVENYRATMANGSVLNVASGDLRGNLDDSRSLDVQKIELVQGSVRYWGKGTITLDSQNRLQGTLTTETNDLEGLLNILDPHLLMSKDQKLNVRTILGLLGQNAKADIIARQGELYLGPFKIAELQPLY